MTNMARTKLPKKKLDYSGFLKQKEQVSKDHGFDPTWMPKKLFPFQRALVEWSTRKGRSAIFADCGLGKTFIQLTWAENVARKTKGRILILTPLAVSFQTVQEGKKLGLEVTQRREGLKKKTDRIVVTNYERLHYFNPEDFDGIVCDESSILKNYDGATKAAITEFMRTRPYRLLCTATAAPNDYMELGTSSEALGEMAYRYMLAMFFTHDSGDTSKWRLKGHVQKHIFWRWVCSWARAMRKPSDLGFDDNGFILPSLTETMHIVCTRQNKHRNTFFDTTAITMEEQREERRRTLPERCEMAADLINAHKNPAVAWCGLNDEATLLEKLIDGAVNVQGSDSNDKKERAFRDFASGDIRVIVSKPTIAGFGLNWQHCAHMTFFPTHSYEQYYQSIRRCWRFGQEHKVTVDLITTEGQRRMMKNLQRKQVAATEMFEWLVQLMNNEEQAPKSKTFAGRQKEALPSWL